MSDILSGHVLDRLADLEAESVSCVVTSPPYWSLRKYDAEDVVWGGKAGCEHCCWNENHATCAHCGAWRGQYGLEPTPELYVEHTLDVLRGIRRVLRPDGVVWWNIGDGYAAASQSHGNPRKRPELTGGGLGSWSTRDVGYSKAATPGLKPKDLVLMPFRIALAAQADGWWVRSVVIWAKPNAMPESVTDRPTTAHEYVLMLTKSARYWYDADAVREAPSESTLHRQQYATGDVQPGHDARNGKERFASQTPAYTPEGGRNLRTVWTFPTAQTPEGGRNLRTVWTFPTAQTPEAHFATFPPELPRRCIEASCPEDGLVLDPFAGVGTTGYVALQLGRRFVGIELSEKYAAIARTKLTTWWRPGKITEPDVPEGQAALL